MVVPYSDQHSPLSLACVSRKIKKGMRLIVPLQGIFQGPGGLVLGTILPCALFYFLQLFLRGRSSSIPDFAEEEAAAKENHDDVGFIAARGLAVDGDIGSPYYVGWKVFNDNPYDAVNNPTGCINLGLAENKLSIDLIEQWFNEHLDSMNRFSLRDIGGYCNYSGLAAFKIALANFMKVAVNGNNPFHVDNIVITSGATAAIEIISFCVADAGDAILVPSPYYPGFERDIKWRSGVTLVPVPSHSNNGFVVTKTALNQAFDQTKKSGRKVRAVLISSPSNPVGNVLGTDTLSMLLDFAREKQIHIIFDEIYAGSVFSAPRFVSVTEVLGDYNQYNATHVHVIYGLSKDFCLPGFRVGVLYTQNRKILAIAEKLVRFCSVSTYTQCVLSAILSDQQFVRNFLAENRKRLLERQSWVVRSLEGSAILHIKGNAGMFCWINLKCADKEEEMRIWSRLLYEAGLNVTPGSACYCTEPGWFRICFANLTDQAMSAALTRLEQIAVSI